MPELIYNQAFYQSEFLKGIYGIWWCDDEKFKSWMISDIKKKGQCKGYARAKPNVTGECIDTIGWIWEYRKSGKYWDAKEGLGVKCILN